MKRKTDYETPKCDFLEIESEQFFFTLSGEEDDGYGTAPGWPDFI